MSDAFWSGLWSGVFELIALGAVAGWINLVYQRIRSRQDLRKSLIEDIDDFSSLLYKPRKLYQYTIEQSSRGDSTDEEHTLTADQLKYLEEFTDAAGAFRALQVKMVPLFAFNVDLFAHYLAVWSAIRMIRKRMERGQDLYAEHEGESSPDALYKLLDQFRYRVQVTPSVKQKPRLLSPPAEVEREIRARAEKISQRYLQGEDQADTSDANDDANSDQAEAS